MSNIVELRGNSEQSPTSHNSPYISSFVCVGRVLKAITDPQAVANGGCFRALTGCFAAGPAVGTRLLGTGLIGLQMFAIGCSVIAAGLALVATRR